MRKLIYISYDGILDQVGQSQVVPYLCGLANSGIFIWLISFEKRECLRNKELFFYYKGLLSKEGIYWRYLIYHKNPNIPATLFDIVNGVMRASVFIKKNNINIVHARSYISGIIAYFLKIFHKVGVIFDMRGFWPEEKVDAGAWKKNGFLYRLFKRLEKKMLIRADEIVVLTEAAKAIIEEVYKVKNISVIPCGVDLGKFSAEVNTNMNFPLSEKRLLVAYLGSIGTFYDFERAVKFFLAFKTRLPQARLLVLSKNDKNQILQILSKFQLIPDDYSVSSVSHEQVPQFLRRCAFSLVFYRRRLSGAGCSPIKFSESLACGIPVVINSGVGDCDMIIRQEGVGVVLQENSPKSYSLAVNQIQAILAKEGIAKRCREVAEKYFSLQGGEEKYLNIYKRFGD